MVGELLDKLNELGLADNTIVMYSTDNGAEVHHWPDGGTTPFRGEKNTNWEGGYRVPAVDPLARRHQARHGHQRHRLPRGHAAHLLAAAGEPDVKEKLLKGMKVGDKTYKVHLDGYNLLDAPERQGERARATSSST